MSRKLFFILVFSMIVGAPSYAHGWQPGGWNNNDSPYRYRHFMRNIRQEEANKRLVTCFYNQFFNKHETEEASEVIAENYKQHNPDVPDGKEPFVSFFTDFFKSHPYSHAQIIRSAAEGDLVYLHVHSTDNSSDLGQAVVDIFRVVNGKIVEHWDVIQNVPEKSANDNTMF